MKDSIYDKALSDMLDNITSEIEKYSHKFIKHINRLSQIGIALSAEKNINKLLEMIIQEAKTFTNADAGTLYLVENDHLKFEILYNDTMGVKLGGTTQKSIDLPPVPIKKNTVSGYVALTGEVVNIKDVYENEEFDFKGPIKYDKKTGYRSKSFLCTPLKNHEDKIIGVLQLINAKNEKDKIIPFAKEYENIIYSLGSQAAITITKTQLIQDIENLFNSFVKVMATAIDERTPYNKKHTERVANYTIKIAEKINEIDTGRFKDIEFSDNELAELNMAAWLHDVGKVAIPVNVMNKSTKLESTEAGFSGVKLRMKIYKKDLDVKLLKNLIDKKDYKKQLEKINQYLQIIKNINVQNKPLSDSQVEKLKKIYNDRYLSSSGEYKKFIKENEYKKLSIRKGTLSFREREIMKNHVVITKKLLEQMPFIDKYKNVTEIATSHHEKLNGEGYPNKKTEEEIPLGGKILAVADLYDALTASDRPYKKRIENEKAFDIMRRAAEMREIDKDLLEIFITNKLYEIS
ncbi:MAG: GAF domain-containing protein [Candidatus Mcinerneyibacterium aminivorans]|uniref:GAF domain-containing protein n=1 Tax=Candidatus Mcinerneyibacterium aminivorans TaxID=2703815 RepID=A0A5D0MGW9_9BACT|nr:MAG: GAF domain-containing protein [Candidatus Mcinerneyibacterium aminivorans]